MAINSSKLKIFGINTLFFSFIVAIINATEPEVHDTLENHGKCEDLTIEMCKSLPYNMTMMPNYFGHELQADAGLGVHQFSPLTRSSMSCKPHLKYYLCLLYAPVCTKSGKILLPCRSLCHDALDECKDYWRGLNVYYPWPEYLNCDVLPDHEAFPDVDCIGNPKTKLSWSLPPPKAKKTQPKDGLENKRD